MGNSRVSEAKYRRETTSVRASKHYKRKRRSGRKSHDNVGQRLYNRAPPQRAPISIASY